MNHFLNVKLDEYERSGLLLRWIEQNPMPFSVSQHIAPGDHELQQIYMRMCDKLVGLGVLSYWRSERGWYRPVEQECPEIDLKAQVPEPVDIWLPFNISDMVEIYPGNVIIFAGCKSAGKTCIALNVCKENEYKFDTVKYFNSEMGGAELRKRTDMFMRPGWVTKFYSRSHEFEAVVGTGINTLNVIDFLEIHDEFFNIGAIFKAIHSKLKDSVCIIFLQKNPGQSVGLGGYRSLELARLYVALEKGVAKITDAKNWVDHDSNPNGKVTRFKIRSGTTISHDGWHREVE